MSVRAFHLLVGLLVLVALCLDLPLLLDGVIAWLVFEAITNWRLVTVLQHWTRPGGGAREQAAPDPPHPCRFTLDAERVMRLLVASLLALPQVLFPGYLWVVDWFAGFALVAAGLSGICPMVLTLRKLGFR